MMNFRLVRPPALVDISRVGELDYVRREGEELRIGATTLHETVEQLDGQAAEGYGILRDAARFVGHFPIRARGTFGGSVAHADPSAEWCMLARLLDATVVARGPDGEREIAAEDFFLGFFTTSLDPGELVTEIRFAAPPARAALEEFARRHGDFAIVAAAVALDLEGDTCRRARIVIGGVDEVPVRPAEAERTLEGAALDPEALAEAAAAAAREVDPSGDIHGSADYRRHLTGVLVGRALERAVNGGG
jgi:carbon-monoxide dehydrogenase medium subunit